MKFKNYVNSLTGDNRIFSNKEIADMSVREVFKNKDAIMRQHFQIGIPSEKELQASDNVVYVQAYTRDDGTEVCAHWRSKPDGIESNNLSFNTSSQSGKSTGGASEINNQKILVSPWNSPFLPKANNENYKLKNELIRFNNEQNKNYKDAKDLMNIALIGPENIQSNPEYKRIDKNDIKRLSKNIGDKLDSKFTTIKFEPNSSLATSINSSPSLKQSINSWCKQTENERGQTISVTINDNENLFRSINNATILNPKIENGVFTGYLYDKYDFKPDEFKDKYTTAVNTGAVTLQTVGILKNYNILVPIKMDLK